MDITRSLRSAVQTGKVQMGEREASRAIMGGQAKLLIYATNAPEPKKTEIVGLANESAVPVYKYDGSNQELGPACGKPFAVSFLAIVEAGESDVLHLAKKGN